MESCDSAILNADTFIVFISFFLFSLFADLLFLSLISFIVLMVLTKPTKRTHHSPVSFCPHSCCFFYRYKSVQPTRVDPLPQISRPLCNSVVARRAAVWHGVWRHSLWAGWGDPQGEAVLQEEGFSWWVDHNSAHNTQVDWYCAKSSSQLTTLWTHNHNVLAARVGSRQIYQQWIKWDLVPLALSVSQWYHVHLHIM